jgi:hypothetical protein
MEPREEIQAAERVEAAPADGAENAEEVAAVYMAVFKVRIGFALVCAKRWPLMRAHIRCAQLAHQESLGVCLYDTLQETLHVARINDVAGLGTREKLRARMRPCASSS